MFILLDSRDDALRDGLRFLAAQGMVPSFRATLDYYDYDRKATTRLASVYT